MKCCFEEVVTQKERDEFLKSSYPEREFKLRTLHRWSCIVSKISFILSWFGFLLLISTAGVWSYRHLLLLDAAAAASDSIIPYIITSILSVLIVFSGIYGYTTLSLKLEIKSLQFRSEYRNNILRNNVFAAVTQPMDDGGKIYHRSDDDDDFVTDDGKDE